MAAGRHGGYRDNQFRGLVDSDFEGSTRENGYPRGGDYGRRNGNSDRGYGREQNIREGEQGPRDRVRLRQKDFNEREMRNGGAGGYRSASSRSDSGSSGGGGAGPRKNVFPVRAIDREPGELSSESGSDGGAVDSESLNNKGCGELKKVENGKRKFSPIIWDRDGDGKKVTRTVKARTSPAEANALTGLPPPLSNSSSTILPDSKPDGPENSSCTQQYAIQSPEGLPSAEKVDEEMDATSLSPVELPHLSPGVEEEKEAVTYNQGAETLDDDYTSTRTIRASRWANEDESSGDEGEIIEEEEMTKLKKKKKYITELAETKWRKSATPELGELRREGSESNRARSSDERIRSGSSDRYADEMPKDDYMEVEEDRPYTGASSSQSDTESDQEDETPRTPEPTGPPPRTVNMLQGCRSVDEFERLNKIDEGTYGVVFRARDKKTGEIVALKKVKMEKEREGFPLTALREINILLSFHHPSIVDVKEVVVGSSLDSIFMVMEYMEHDLKALMESMKQPFSQSEVKCLMLQLIGGVKYLHDNWVLHRDLKTSNILLNNRGELKICDFGLARQYGSPLKPYTQLVVTLWYRAPELLLGAKEYSTAIDMWSLGCIMAELLAKKPLFNGQNEIDQLVKIYKVLGTPNEKIWPGLSKLTQPKVNMVKNEFSGLRAKFPPASFTGSPVLSDAGFDLLNRLLTYDPEKRITAEAALNHEWFREVPLPKSKEFMPTFPAQHAQDRRTRRVQKSPDPLEEQRRKELQQGGLGTGGLFG
ncbi:OLC1v1028717C3 [Oldenlandia corymbosa var. corymbosa]|uniref:cyclin-dependent kinase n=1 Tax=Oldenlandia corymbosa var. corymbosa TaxID=529605 RepID=A0AAV1CF57_OLDCO|nr:OLC1v1028717C3 [Oldenlandia corymbosa var. corymbosa]